MTPAFDWTRATIDGVPFDRWGFILTSQDIPRAVPLTELRELPGGGYVDLTWRDAAGYPALSPIQARLALRHRDDEPDRVAADVAALVAAVQGRRIAYRPWNRPNVEYVGVARATVEEDAGRWCRVSVEIMCEPEAYGAAHEAALAAGSNTLHVGGDRPSRPTLTLTASAAGQVQAAYSQTGQYVRTRDSVAAGAVVVFDMAAMTATVGGAHAAVTPASEFFSVAPGSAGIVVANASGDMVWRDRWS